MKKLFTSQDAFELQAVRSELDALSIPYKNNGIYQLKIRMVDNEKWYAEWENDDGEPIQISKKYVTDIIDSIFEEEYTVIISK